MRNEINEAARKLLNELRGLVRHAMDSDCLYVIDDAMHKVVGEVEVDNKRLREALREVKEFMTGIYPKDDPLLKTINNALADQQPKPNFKSQPKL